MKNCTHQHTATVATHTITPAGHRLPTERTEHTACIPCGIAYRDGLNPRQAMAVVIKGVAA